MIKGIAVCNPVDIDKDYLLFTVDYAAKMGFNHIQIVGPIHDAVKGNIDGMTLYRKYSMFNDEKDFDYVKHAVESVNEACVKTVARGIKTYVWHHELELPGAFKDTYPEVSNSCGDIEVTHLKPLTENVIHVVMGSSGDMLEVRVTIGEKEYEIREKVCGRKELIFPYTAGEGCSSVRIRFDKISGYTPYVFRIKVDSEKVW